LTFDKKIKRNANNAGIGNKLVTIFARHRDNFAMTINFSFFPALDKSVMQGQIILRRDWQKLRHGGLPPGLFSGTLLRCQLR